MTDLETLRAALAALDAHAALAAKTRALADLNAEVESLHERHHKQQMILKGLIEKHKIPARLGHTCHADTVRAFVEHLGPSVAGQQKRADKLERALAEREEELASIGRLVGTEGGIVHRVAVQLDAKDKEISEREAECERLRSEIQLAHGRGQDVCLERLTKAGGFGEWPGIVPLRDAWRERDTLRAQLAERDAYIERCRQLLGPNEHDMGHAVSKALEDRTQLGQAQKRIAECGAVIEAVREFQELAGNRDADLDAEINAQRRVLSIALPEKRKP